MARTIGKINKRKLLAIIKEEVELQKKELFFSGINYNSLENAIKNRIPESWYDTWECAYSEIENLVSDALNNYAHYKEVKF